MPGWSEYSLDQKTLENKNLALKKLNQGKMFKVVTPGLKVAPEVIANTKEVAEQNSDGSLAEIRKEKMSKREMVQTGVTVLLVVAVIYLMFFKK